MNISPNNVVCFVADFRYLIKNFSRIYKELREIGKYQGDILIITSLLTPTFLIKEIRKKNNVKIFRFRKVRFIVLVRDPRQIYNSRKLASKKNSPAFTGADNLFEFAFQNKICKT